MKFSCPQCGQHLEAEDNDVGLIAECPSCHCEFPITPPKSSSDKMDAQPPPDNNAATIRLPSPPLPPSPPPPTHEAPRRVRVQCPHCKCTIFAPLQAIGKNIPCPFCKKSFLALKVPPPAPHPSRTIGESVRAVAPVLILLFILGGILFWGYFALLFDYPTLAMWFLLGGILVSTILTGTWFIWTLVCLRTIALCMTDASEDRFRQAAMRPDE